MRGGNSSGNLRNPCLTMHQPWASLLVYGIKRIEGRSWPAPIRGRLWIHAAAKVPEEATIKAMEDFYREIYAVNGITDIKFPQHYPVSRLLGCVEVVGCVTREELAGWELVPEGVRLEAQTDMCWLCEQPQKLLIPFEMRGYQGVYNLEKKIYEGAIRGLTSVEVPLAVKFPLPNPQDPFSLKPGSVSANVHYSKTSEVERSSTLNAAIAGAQAAATQFSKKAQTSPTTSQNDAAKSSSTVSLKSDSFDVDKGTSTNFGESSSKGNMTSPNSNYQVSRRDTPSSGALRPQTGAPSKIFEGAIRGLTPVEVPLQVKYPFPNPLDASIAGAHAVQVSKYAQTSLTSSQYHAAKSTRTLPLKSESVQMDKVKLTNFTERSSKGAIATNRKNQVSSNEQPSYGALRPHPGAPSKHGYEWRKRGETQL